MTRLRPRRFAAAATILALVVATLGAATVVAVPGTFSVTGHVSNANGDPLTCQSVIARADGAQFFAQIADVANGDYALTGLVSGTQYLIRATGCLILPDLAYAGQSYATLVSGAPAEIVSGIDFVLEGTEPARLTFEVRSTFDTPYTFCDVAVVDAYISWGTFSTATTGNATVIVPPGTYTASLPYGCDGNPQAFYGGTSAADATPIELEPGSATLPWMPYPPTKFQVTGHLADPDGAPLNCEVVAIDPGSGFAVKRTTPAAGAWSIVDLDPDIAYEIRATGCFVASDVAYVGSTWPDPVQAAATATVADIDFVLDPVAPATFDLTVLSPTDTPYSSCSINLVNIDDVASQPLLTDVNGHIAVNLVPGNYAFGLPSGCGDHLGTATYYDGELSWSEGDPVVMTAGATTTLSWHPYGSPTPTDTDAPIIACDAAPTGWATTNVTIQCTATDADSGLADAADAAFSLSTSVAAGSADADATTDSAEICDVAGNCATAGPVAGLQVDLADPTVAITGLVDGATITIGASIAPGASCGDVGSGIASCSVTALDTSTLGTKLITATAVDVAGRVSTATATVTVRYGTCGLQAKSARNGLTTVTFKACNAAGANLSSASLPATAIGLSGAGGSVALVTPNGTSFVFVAKSRSYQLVISTSGFGKGAYVLEVTIGSDLASYPLAIRLR